jgi:hypothetical protein
VEARDALPGDAETLREAGRCFDHDCIRQAIEKHFGFAIRHLDRIGAKAARDDAHGQLPAMVAPRQRPRRQLADDLEIGVQAFDDRAVGLVVEFWPPLGHRNSLAL